MTKCWGGWLGVFISPEDSCKRLGDALGTCGGWETMNASCSMCFVQEGIQSGSVHEVEPRVKGSSKNHGSIITEVELRSVAMSDFVWMKDKSGRRTVT